MARSSKGLRSNRRGPRALGPVALRGSSSADPRFVVSGATWELYDRLSDAIDEQKGIRLAFDGQDLEIMVLGPSHEGLKDLMAFLIRELAIGLALDHLGLGQTSWKRSEQQRGIEADLCFYFDSERIAVAQAAMARGSNDVNDYPNPDLAVEIDVSRSKIDRESIYKALRVSEVWRLHKGKISIEQLGKDGKYAPVDQSAFLHVTCGEIERWLDSGRSRKASEWVDDLRAWIEIEVRPRSDGSGE